MGKISEFFGFEPEQIREEPVNTGDYVSSVSVFPSTYAAWRAGDPKSLMRISSVSRSIQIIATMVSSLELALYDNKLQVEPSAFIRRPDPSTPRKLWVQELVTSMGMYGNAYAKVVRDGRGAVAALTILEPSRVTVTKPSDVTKYTVDGKTIATKDIVHFKLDRLPGEPEGYGPIQYASEVFELALMLERYAATQFNVDTIPRGKVTTNASVNTDDAAEIAEGIKKFIQDNSGILVLTDGFDYEQFVGDPNKTQFLEVQKMVDLKIARVFGVPAEALQMGTDNSSTYQNTQDQNMRFLQSTLSRYLTEIEEQLTELLPYGKSAKFIEEDLFRLDVKGKWEVVEIQERVGYTNGDELRAEEGKAPLPKLDKSTDKEPPVKDGD
ncbi:portal protein [Rhodococcoides trifolii]|uniref:Portal protein n=1 Tax=Rhodococcoides trifolii TaxID=908250 RepID=A0A917FYE7_9NOCA|nr:phage portal protein [Rhodococcus trifolii]GGG14125.1 portal protein [Rhodococcus trifolii]